MITHVVARCDACATLACLYVRVLNRERSDGTTSTAREERERVRVDDMAHSSPSFMRHTPLSVSQYQIVRGVRMRDYDKSSCVA